jgi:hypothetical protein
MAEIYRRYQNNRININNKTKPYVFSDVYKKEHSPVIIFEGGDYLPMFNNWSIHDKLQIQNNFIKYTYCELWEGSIVLITGSFLLGTIYSIISMIGETLRTFKKEDNLLIDLTISGNAKMILKMQNRLMDINHNFLETYCIQKNQTCKIEYSFDGINGHEINTFTNRFLELFVSENPRSNVPFSSAKTEETNKFYNLLLEYEDYVVIDN